MDPMEIDWDALLAEAIDAMKHAYCPYPNLPVGAAGLTTNGWPVSGCNVENAGYGTTLCTECDIVSDLTRSGGSALVAVVAVNGNEEPVASYGCYHQLIYEHGGFSCLVLTLGGITLIAEALPDAFESHDLSNTAQMAPTSSEEKEGHDGSF